MADEPDIAEEPVPVPKPKPAPPTGATAPRPVPKREPTRAELLTMGQSPQKEDA